MRIPIKFARSLVCTTRPGLNGLFPSLLDSATHGFRALQGRRIRGDVDHNYDLADPGTIAVGSLVLLIIALLLGLPRYGAWRLFGGSSGLSGSCSGISSPHWTGIARSRVAAVAVTFATEALDVSLAKVFLQHSIKNPATLRQRGQTIRRPVSRLRHLFCPSLLRPCRDQAT